MTDPQTQLEYLLTAYRTGARRVSYDGKSTEYGSPEEMREAIASLQAAINGPPTPRTLLVRSWKGW